ncbi:hypothetical protein R6Z07M_013631 [Ovis aries]
MPNLPAPPAELPCQTRLNAPPRPSCQSKTARPSAHGVPPHIPKVPLVRLLCTTYSRTARPCLQAVQLCFCACGTLTHAEAESGEWRSQRSVTGPAPSAPRPSHELCAPRVLAPPLVGSLGSKTKSPFTRSRKLESVEPRSPSGAYASF